MLQDVAAVADIVGAIGVMVSLIFVGLQVKQANQLAREAAEQKQIESIGSLSRILAENPQLAEAWARAAAGEKLTAGEQISITSMITHGQRIWEALYYQYRRGRVPQELWDAHRTQARAIQSSPLSQMVWKQRKHWFSKSYREFRDGDGDGASVAPPPAEAPKQ